MTGNPGRGRHGGIDEAAGRWQDRLDKASAGPARQDAAYFATWMERVLAAAAARDDDNTDQDRRATPDCLRGALDHYHALAAARASAPP